MMQNKEITKQMIEFHKKAFETGFDSMLVLQEQTSKVMDNFLKQSPWIPFQTKSIVNEWTSLYKKGAVDFKEAADKNYAKMEEVLSSGFEAVKSKSKN
ncbi:MAG: hypothetical protein K4571_12080 [Deltaproteobacteria bacterium]